MSSLSDAAMRLTTALFEDPDGTDSNKVTYEVKVADLRDNAESIMTMRFQLKTPVDEEDLIENAENLFDKLSNTLLSTAATQLGSLILARNGFKPDDFKKPPKIRGIVDVQFGAPDEEVVDDGISVGVQTSKGRLVSQANLRSMLELTMKEYMLREMTGPGAGRGNGSPLRNRTGRFVNTSEVVNTVIKNTTGGGPQSLSIYYRYMIYPYQVFDPRNTQSPQKNLASTARNPQRIIGNALARAARTLLGSNYKLTVKQVL